MDDQVNKDSTCISLGLRQFCETCTAFDNKQRRGRRRKCKKPWDESFKNHRFKGLATRYDNAWEDITSRQRAPINKEGVKNHDKSSLRINLRSKRSASETNMLAKKRCNTRKTPNRMMEKVSTPSKKSPRDTKMLSSRKVEKQKTPKMMALSSPLKSITKSIQKLKNYRKPNRISIGTPPTGCGDAPPPFRSPTVESIYTIADAPPHAVSYNPYAESMDEIVQELPPLGTDTADGRMYVSPPMDEALGQLQPKVLINKLDNAGAISLPVSAAAVSNSGPMKGLTLVTGNFIPGGKLLIDYPLINNTDPRTCTMKSLATGNFIEGDVAINRPIENETVRTCTMKSLATGNFIGGDVAINRPIENETVRNINDSQCRVGASVEQPISDEDLLELFERHAERLGYSKDDNNKEQSNWKRLINKSALTKLQHNNQFVNRIKKILSRKKYYDEGNEFSKRLYGLAAGLSPKASFANIELIIALARAGLVDDLNFTQHLGFDPKYIPNISPGEGFIASCLGKVAADRLFLLRVELTADGCIRVYLNCDKGQNGMFIKVLSFWCKKEKRVKLAFLDFDRAGSTSKECAQAIKFSTDRICIEGFKYAGATTDSGGGGTGVSFRDEMSLLQLIDEIFYLMNFCGMHIVQLTFKNPAEKVLGMSGLNARSAMQAVFQLFYLQDETPTKRWQLILEYIAKDIGVEIQGVDGSDGTIFTMPAPVLTRWWTIGQAVRYIIRNLDLFKILPLYFIYGSDTNKITSAASDVFSLLKEKTIIADMILIDCFCANYLHPNFQWFQTGDAGVGGTPGFKGRLAFVRFFLMDKMLEGWSKGGWKEDKDMEPLKNYVYSETDVGAVDDAEENENVEELEEADEGRAENQMIEEGIRLDDIEERPLNVKLQELKADEFFRISLVSLHKHFRRYGRELALLSLFGEPPTAKIVARHILRMEPIREETDPKEFESYHQSNTKGKTVTIDLEAFAAFVEKKVDRNQADRCPHINRLKRVGGIQRIANGLDIWNDSAGLDLKTFYEEMYAALGTTTHFVEGAVKLGKDADNGGRSEKRMSHHGLLANARKDINRATMERLKKQKESKGKSFKNEEKVKARGKAKSIETIRYAMKMHREIEGLLRASEENRTIYNKISKLVIDESEAFENERAKKEFNDFLDITKKRKEKNEMGLKATKHQRMMGFDIAPLVRRMVAFSDLRKKDHLDLFRAELRAKNIEFSMDDGIKKLIVLMKNYIQSKQDRKAENITHFKPIAATYFDYYPDDLLGDEEDNACGERASSTQERELSTVPPHATSQTASHGNNIDTHHADTRGATTSLIQISKLRKAHHTSILLELQRREVMIPPEDANKITKLKKLLKEHEKVRTNQAKPPAFFEPLFTPIIHYKDILI